MPETPEKFKYKNVPKTLRQAFYAASSDPDILSLHEEASLLRSMLARVLACMERRDNDDGEIEREDLVRVVGLIKEIRDTIGTMAAVEGKMNMYIHVNMFPQIINSMVNIIKMEVGDERILGRISKQLGDITVDGSGRRAAALTGPGVGEEALTEPLLVREGSIRKQPVPREARG